MTDNAAPFAPWSGALALLPGAVLYQGAGGDAEWHKHHAAQIMIGLAAPFSLTFTTHQGQRDTLTGTTMIIPSGMPHQLQSRSELFTLLLIEPSGPRGRAIADLAASPAPLPEEDKLRKIIREGYSGTKSAASLVDQLLEQIAHQTVSSAPLSEPVRAAMRYLEATASTGRTSLIDAANSAHISPSRLTHRFSQEVGIPFRRYTLWVRLRIAAQAVADGARGLTDAAAAAGFSDAAHLSRAFKRNFGLVPSALMGMRIAEDDWPEHPTHPQQSTVP